MTTDNSIVIRVRETQVATACSANISVFCEKGPFRLQEVLIDPAVGRKFFITDLKVGKISQLISSSAVSASFFDETTSARQENLTYNTLPRGSLITLSVTNLTADVAEFSANLRGILVEDEHPYESGRFFVGLGHTLISPKGTCNIAVQPQISFMPDMLVVPMEVFDGLRVRDVRSVGTSVVGVINAEGYRSGRIDGSMVMDLAPSKMQIGDWLCVEVVNDTDDPKAFYGTIVGSGGK